MATNLTVVPLSEEKTTKDKNPIVKTGGILPSVLNTKTWILIIVCGLFLFARRDKFSNFFQVD